jgi:hypothetical protein
LFTSLTFVSALHGNSGYPKIERRDLESLKRFFHGMVIRGIQAKKAFPAMKGGIEHA